MLGAPPVNWTRLMLTAVLLVLCILLQRAQVDSLGWGFDLGLTVLISAAIFLNPLDLAFLEIIALAFFMWKPFISVDLFLLLLIPWGAFWGKKILSGDLWVQNLAFVSLGIVLFYSLQSVNLFFENWVLMLNNLIGCAILGSILYFFFENLYASRLD